ncbi:SGNH/GDSL hydrolase family protein [Arthrobacter sp. LAPM80]|uniref:SGNH/GDSL hydrolase family protein n=1 Tax=Arthrobacter sp. LAPM80 TaxID=3141788 RepID=UPI00398AFA27
MLVVTVALLGVGPGNATQVPGPVEATATAVDPPATLPERNAVPDGGRSPGIISRDEMVTVWDLPAGSLVLNPASGRKEVIDPDIAREAVLFGDSQSAGAAGIKAPDTWVEKGIAASGYKVHFLGAGGIGFVARNGKYLNYLDALTSGQVVLPYGNPALVVVQGGGNDAGRGATNAQILSNAADLLRELKASYPVSDFLFIGTLARATAAGGGRRSEVDAVLAGFAKDNGIPFISAGDWLTGYSLTRKMADGVHLTKAGHKELAVVLAGKIKALGLVGPEATAALRP